MKSKECAILIPLYKNDLYDYEEISLKQCIRLLSEKYKIYFMISEDVNIFDIFHKYDINLKFVDDFEYISYSSLAFRSIETFNELLLTCDIYNILQNDGYEYMLLYELDVFVFYDNLEYWINKHYDFIGSFGFHHSNSLSSGYKSYGMNGGVSLRNVQYCKNTLDSIEGSHFFGNCWEDQLLTWNKKIKSPKTIDTFSFAWSYNYDTSYIMNDFKLPMFAHYYQCNEHMFKICKRRYENNIISDEL